MVSTPEPDEILEPLVNPDGVVNPGVPEWSYTWIKTRVSAPMVVPPLGTFTVIEGALAYADCAVP
jgi:hypothetical protein